MFNGLIFYFHWDAELISYLAKVVIPMPFSNMAAHPSGNMILVSVKFDYSI